MAGDDKSTADGGGVQIGPDLNCSRSPLDKKLYRQILLPNGLRCVLISDTIALRQQEHNLYDDGDYSSDDDDDGDDQSANLDSGDNRESGNNSEGGESDDEDSDEDEREDGLRNAAAAMLVGVGSYFDPVEAQGMAHFLEHMLFMGTKKYPTENAYDSFLSSNGGSDNAYTELEYTLYHFDIPQEKLFKALDMFAQFFIDPLLLPNAVDRELNSIESEFQLSKNSDGCRFQELLCYTGHHLDRHPFGKFSWGNLLSLKDTPLRNGVDMMKELRKFYDQYYFAANQRLVLIGAYSLDELQDHVVKYFSDVPAAPRAKSDLLLDLQTPPSWEKSIKSAISSYGMPFSDSSLARLYRIVPVKDKHTLCVTWQVPPCDENNWKSKPEEYIAHLLGHESKGSLLSALKQKSWATGCEAGCDDSGHYNSSSHRLMYMSFALLEDGVKNWHEIVSYVYMYIGMIRQFCSSESGLPDWIYEELRSIHEVSYKYEDESSPEDLVESIAEEFNPACPLPPDRLLDGNSLLFEFNAEAVQTMVDEFMTPMNSRVDLISSSFGRAADFGGENAEHCPSLLPNNIPHKDNDGTAMNFSVASDDIPQTEPMFGTTFWCHPIDSSLLKEWAKLSSPAMPPLSSNLNLPPVNPYIPTEFNIKPLPPDDTHHPLLHCSFKMCIVIGKKKTWLPATSTKYNSTTNSMLFSYEDEDKKWHIFDMVYCKSEEVRIDYEGTVDSKKIKFRITALPAEGQGAILRYGDESDYDVEDGLTFPPIPPSQPSSRLPALSVDNKTLKLWYLQDRKFHRPIAELRLRLICPNSNRSPLQRAVSDLFVVLCGDAILETTYMASVCELYSSIRSNDTGFSISVSGFDDKLLDLAEETLNACLSFRCVSNETLLPSIIKPGRFDASLESLLRSYRNSGMKSSKQVTDIRLQCLRPTMWSAHAKLKALEDITVQSFNKVISENLEFVTVEAFLHGNCDQADAIRTEKIITKAINKNGNGGFAKKKWPYQQVIKVPLKNQNHILVAPSNDPNEPNTAVEIYFQISMDNRRTRVIIDLLSHIMYEPLFDQLRTKEQFGYEVSCGPRWTFGIIGLSFKVVTASKSSTEVCGRIERFLTDFRKDLVEMKREVYIEHLVGLAKSKLEMNNSLVDECSDFWEQIVEHTFEWESSRSDTVELRNVAKSEVIEAFDKWLAPASPQTGVLNKRRRLVVQVIGTATTSEGPSTTSMTMGSPFIVQPGSVGITIDNSVKDFHELAGNGATWGKIV